jgi:hypothetical protein
LTAERESAGIALAFERGDVMQLLRSTEGFAVAAALLCGCIGGNGGGIVGSGTPDAGPLKLVRSVSIGLNLNALDGSDDILGVSYTDTTNNGSTTGFRETLHLYKHQSAAPDDLLDLGNVYLGVDTLYHRVPHIAFSPDWAAVTIDFNDGPSGWIALVSLANPAPVRTATLPLAYVLDRALAAGRWLLVAGGQRLDLFDLVNPSSPSLAKSFTTAGLVTCFAAVTDGFLVVTDSGYGHVHADPANATYSETADASVRSFRKAYVSQGSAYVGGPSPIAGKSRIGRVDLSDPAHPMLVLSLDVDGNFTGFAYDGSSRYLLEIKGKDLSSGDRAIVYLENQGSLTLTAQGPMAPTFGNASRLFARDGHAYLLESGLSIYRLP